MGGTREPGGDAPVINGQLLYRADSIVSRWIAKRIPGYRINEDARTIGVLRGKDLVAAVVYEGWNGVHVEACIAAEPGARWATRPVLRALFEYPFIGLGCKAISVSIPASNLPSLKLAMQMGFEGEAIVRFAAPDGSDLVVMKMFRDKCGWIGHG